MHELFFELHESLPRQGPGSSESTRRALSLLALQTDSPYVLDIGCGPGKQTVELAKRWPMGMITAVDTHEPYLVELEEHCRREGIQNVYTSRESMFSLPYPEQSFEVIWSEGAIYIMGFPEGLSAWKPLLKPGGYLVVSELNWIRPDPPDEIRRFWEDEYPGITTIEGALHHIKLAGYELEDHFILPNKDWYTEYYTPLSQRIDQWKEERSSDPAVKALINFTREEITMCDTYSRWYSYVFYILRSISH